MKPGTRILTPCNILGLCYGFWTLLASHAGETPKKGCLDQAKELLNRPATAVENPNVERVHWLETKARAAATPLAQVKERFKQWSKSTSAPQISDSFIALSGEPVLRAVLDKYRAKYTWDPHQQVLVLHSLPTTLRDTEFGAYFNEVQAAGIELAISTRVSSHFDENDGGFSAIDRRITISHRALAQEAPLLTEIHELAHLHFWQRQKAGEDLLLAGTIIGDIDSPWAKGLSPRLHGVLPLDEIVAHIEAIDHTLTRLEKTFDPNERADLLWEIRREAEDLARYRQKINEPVEKLEVPRGLDRERLPARGGYPSVESVEISFQHTSALPDGFALILESPPRYRFKPVRTKIRLRALQDLLKVIQIPVEALEAAARVDYGAAAPVGSLRQHTTQILHLLKNAQDEYEKAIKATQPR